MTSNKISLSTVQLILNVCMNIETIIYTLYKQGTHTAMHLLWPSFFIPASCVTAWINIKYALRNFNDSTSHSPPRWKKLKRIARKRYSFCFLIFRSPAGPLHSAVLLCTAEVTYICIYETNLLNNGSLIYEFNAIGTIYLILCIFLFVDNNHKYEWRNQNKVVS